LFKGLQAACFHSKTSHDQIRSIISKITADLMTSQKREIPAQELGQIVMDHLHKVDEIAYIRFACVYKRFKDIEELKEAIDSIAKKEKVLP